MRRRFLGDSCHILPVCTGGVRKAGVWNAAVPGVAYKKGTAERPVQLTNVPGEARGRGRSFGRGLLALRLLLAQNLFGEVFCVCVFFPLLAATTKVRWQGGEREREREREREIGSACTEPLDGCRFVSCGLNRCPGLD